MNKAAAFPGRAWRLLRVAILWARRGGAFRRGFFVDLRLSRGYLRGAGRRANGLRCGEREFSIADTPIFRFKPPSARLLRIPCITPAAPVDFDDDDDDDLIVLAKRRSGRSCGGHSLDEGEIEDGADAAGQDWCRRGSIGAMEELEEEDGGIDVRAEEFIEKFHQQMRMQRQISLIQYNEMLLRSRC